jgi:hypothetical protein
VLSAGRPVLFVPYAGAFTSIGERVFVAWDGSREAVRAAHDAIPFLAHAKRTTVAAVVDGIRRRRPCAFRPPMPR